MGMNSGLLPCTKLLCSTANIWSDYRCSQGKQYCLPTIPLHVFLHYSVTFLRMQKPSLHTTPYFLFNSCHFAFSERLNELQQTPRHLCSYVINCSTWCHYHSQPSFTKCILVGQHNKVISIKHSALYRNNRLL